MQQRYHLRAENFNAAFHLFVLITNLFYLAVCILDHFLSADLCVPDNNLGTVSGPLLDRIDLHIEVPAVAYEELEQRQETGESSAKIKERVDRAREIQMARYRGSGIYSNSQLTPGLMEEFCSLEPAAAELLRQAFENLGLSARAHNRILKVARTIADLSGSKGIEPMHLAEAIQYRSLDRKFWA